jgi:signal transduction histidine kinase
MGLIDSSELLVSILNSVPFGIIVLDAQGNIQLCNQNAKELLTFDHPDEKIIGTSIIAHVHHVSAFARELEHYLIDPANSGTFESIPLKDRTLDISLHTVEDGFLIIINDITGMKDMETSSIQAIITGQENERKRLAREIHDGIGPLLSSAKLELDLFLEELKEHDNRIPDTKLYSIRQTMDSISVDLRDLSHRLIPRLLEEFGLFSAFSNLVNRFKNSTKSTIDLYSNVETGERFDKDIELNLFRCGQELLHNALKHAKAKKIILQLIKHEDSIVLMVEDDGIGFNPGEVQTPQDGIGLINIETRVRALNGDLLVEADKGHGTLVSIELPL